MTAKCPFRVDESDIFQKMSVSRRRGRGTARNRHWTGSVRPISLQAPLQTGASGVQRNEAQGSGSSEQADRTVMKLTAHQSQWGVATRSPALIGTSGPQRTDAFGATGSQQDAAQSASQRAGRSATKLRGESDSFVENYCFA